SVAAEHLDVVNRIVTQVMEEDPSMIGLFTWRHGPGSGIARVIEAAAVRHPGQRAGPRPLNAVGKVGAGDHVPNAQSRLLGPVARQAVSQELAVAAGIPPIQGDASVLGQGVDIEEDTVAAAESLADEEDRLILQAGAPSVEIASLDRTRRADVA